MPWAWAVPLFWLLVLGALWALWTLTRFGTSPSSDPAVQWLAASRQMADQTEWHAVQTLPDHWVGEGLQAHGTARYRLEFDMTFTGVLDSQQRGWALLIGSLSTEHRITLNGELLEDTHTDTDALGEPSMALINIPGGSLRQGRNVLDITVHARSRGGLSQPAIGPWESLVNSYQINRAVLVFLPLVMNLTGLTFSVFIIGLWMVRRAERAAGYFGMLTLVVAARNCFYYLPNEINLPLEVSSWLFFTAHVWGACMLGWFMLALTDTTAPLLKRAFDVVLVSFPILAALMIPLDDDLRQTRNALQPVLIALVGPSLWLMWRHVRANPGRSLMGLMGGLFIIGAAGIHDYLGARVVQHPEFWNWMPWAVPLATPGFAMLLISRISQAFNQLEHINQSLEQQVTERTRELEQANLAKSRFLAAASHDLRQPVAAIGLMTELLGQRVQTPEQQGLTQRLSEAVISMENQLKGLLDLSRLDAGDIVARPQRVCLSTLCQSILSHEQLNARDKGLRLRAHAPKHLQAWADPVLLEQVLRNLVGNAVRHTRRGGVLVGVRTQGNRLRVEVWDTGPGIAVDDQRRVFDEFVQLGTGSGHSQGLGLGLAIARRAAILLGTRLSLRSRPGRGSCFSLDVPRDLGVRTPRSALPPTSASEAPSDAPSDTPTAPSSAQPTSGRRVLLVEDEAPLRQALALLFQDWGWQVDACASLSELKQQAQGPWQLLVSDHRLPDGFGGDVLRWARRQQPDLPALVITGDTAPEQLRELAALNVPVLHKPFRPEKMRAMVEETMALGT